MSRRSSALAVILAVLALTAVFVVPTRRGEVIAIAGLIAFAGVFVILSGAVGRGVVHGSAVDAVLHRPIRPATRPSDLEKLERSLGWRTYEGAEFDVRVRPLLVDLIRHRGGTDADVDRLLAHPERVTTEDMERMVTGIEALGRGVTR